MLLKLRPPGFSNFKIEIGKYVRVGLSYLQVMKMKGSKFRNIIKYLSFVNN